MRSSLPAIATPEAIVDSLRHHQSEIAVFSAMVASLGLITGGALSVLFSPNLGEQLSFPSILKPGSLQEGHISMFGNTILELSRPLRIEIVEETTSGDREAVNESKQSETEHLSIVSPAEFQPQLLEEAHDKGTRLLIIILIATVGLYTTTRLLPHIPLGPKRRKPLGERLANSDAFVSDHPLAVKPMPRIISISAKRERKKFRQASAPLSHPESAAPIFPSASSTSTPTTIIPSRTFSLAISVHPEQNPKQKRRTVTLQAPILGQPDSSAIAPSNQASQSSISTTRLQQETRPTVSQLSLPTSAPSTDWLKHLDVRHEKPLTKIL